MILCCGIVRLNENEKKERKKKKEEIGNMYDLTINKIKMYFPVLCRSRIRKKSREEMDFRQLMTLWTKYERRQIEKGPKC